MDECDKSKKQIIRRKIALSIQVETIPKYQSIGKYNSSLVSMIEESLNNQGKSVHHEGHALDVLINKRVLITLCYYSMLQATHHLLQIESLEQRNLKGQ